MQTATISVREEPSQGKVVFQPRTVPALPMQERTLVPALHFFGLDDSPAKVVKPGGLFCHFLQPAEKLAGWNCACNDAMLLRESPSGSHTMSTAETFNRFLARQPVLSKDKKFFAYEILSRYGPENYCSPAPDGSIAEKAMDELFLMGVRAITEGLPAFINCTRDFLLHDYLTLMPKDMVVGEILETVTPDPEVLAACQRMKEQGYRLALDDYCDLPETQPFLDLADFVKVDVLFTSFAEQERLVQVCHQRKIPVVAEKVETDEQFRRCMDIGYDYFQGYFFCRPEVVGRRSVPANKTVYLGCCKLPTPVPSTFTEFP